MQERVIHNHLLDHLLKRNAISSSQYGFRPGASTQEALITATQAWHQVMEEGGSSVCIFLDLPTA